MTDAGGGGTTLGAPWGGGGGVAAGAGTLCVCGFGGKRGVVFAVAGAPVRGGAVGRAEGGSACGGGGGILAMLGIGLVTAVDQAGGTFTGGAGSN